MCSNKLIHGPCADITLVRRINSGFILWQIDGEIYSFGERERFYWFFSSSSFFVLYSFVDSIFILWLGYERTLNFLMTLYKLLVWMNCCTLRTWPLVSSMLIYLQYQAIYHTKSDTLSYIYINYIFIIFAFLCLKSYFYNETITAKIFLLIQGGHVKKCKQILKMNLKKTQQQYQILKPNRDGDREILLYKEGESEWDRCVYRINYIRHSSRQMTWRKCWQFRFCASFPLICFNIFLHLRDISQLRCMLCVYNKMSWSINNMVFINSIIKWVELLLNTIIHSHTHSFDLNNNEQWCLLKLSLKFN